MFGKIFSSAGSIGSCPKETGTPKDRKSSLRQKIHREAFIRAAAAAAGICCLLTGILLSGPGIRAQAQNSAGQIVIVLDPGHGGVTEEDLGAQYAPYSEKQLTLALAQAVKAELEQYDNVAVYLTRTTDTPVSLADRVNYAAALKADFFYSIHFNASSGHEFYGSEVLIPSKGTYYQQGYSFGMTQLTELQALGLYPRGLKTKIGNNGDYYGILRRATAAGIPSVIVEHCYLDHGVDRSFLSGSTSLEMLAHADAKAIAEYFHLSSAKLSADYSGYTRVQVQAPAGAVYQDTTPPEHCSLQLLSRSSSAAAVRITAQDTQSPVIYYSYSSDGGKSWSVLLPFDRSRTIWDVSIPLTAGTKSLKIRVYNLYELYTESEAITF